MEQGSGELKSARKFSLCKIRPLAIFSVPKRNASNIAARKDLGWCTALKKQRLEVIRLFFPIQNVNNNRLIKNVHMWSYTVKRSWEYTLNYYRRI